MNSHATSSPTATRKRIHLKKSQVTTLQNIFSTNKLPDSNLRSRLARELAITERTIQVWFQNRRAKAKKDEALCTIMMIPQRLDQQDQQLISKRPRSSSKPEPKSSHLSDLTDTMRATSTMAKKNAAAAVVEFHRPIVPLPVNVLRIGSWTRFAHASSHLHQRDWDLVCYGSPLDRELIWRVQDECHHFRIQVSFDNIRQLRLSQQVQVETGELVGQLDIETSVPLAFSMWRFGQDQQWVRCDDFTEDKQASVHGFHTLQGNHEAFQQALLELIALASELASRISVTKMMMDSHYSPPGLDLCRDFTMSPSATPEPSSLLAAGSLPYDGSIHPQHLSKTNHMSHLMLQAPFIYPSQTQGSTTTDNHQCQQQRNQELHQMMIQQQSS